MASLYDYVRVAVFEKFPRNLALSDKFVERDQLVKYFLNKAQLIMKEFGVFDSVLLEYFSESIFQEFERYGLVDTLEDPIAGTFYRVNLKKINSYMSASLVENEIYQRKQRLDADKLYTIVFSNLPEEMNADDFGADIANTASPTIKTVLSESERSEFRSYIAPLKEEVEIAGLSQEEKADALAALDAIDILSESPNPLWSVIYAIMSSPILMNFTALATLAMAVLKA